MAGKIPSVPSAARVEALLAVKSLVEESRGGTR